jgi:hypothetical protein
MIMDHRQLNLKLGPVTAPRGETRDAGAIP